MQAKSQEIALTNTTYSEKIPNYDDEDVLDRSYGSASTRDSIRLLSDYSTNRYFGKNIVFGFKNGEPRFSLGPHWPLFMITWLVLEAGGIYYVIKFSDNLSLLMKIISIFAIIWQGFIYLATALTNPGIHTAANPEDPELMKLTENRDFCIKCKVMRDENTVHCVDCKVCIKGYDHHCPWTGKCIGEGNLKPFYLFLFSTMAYIVYFMILTFQALPH